MSSVQLHLGDCLDFMQTLSENSIDSIVCDPPYEIGFMGKSWDSTGIAYNVEVWREGLRVLKPGGHLLAFGGSRTYHRLACAVEDAGFEIRDQIMWIYGSGFPKSLDVGKAIDKAAGLTGEYGDFKTPDHAIKRKPGNERMHEGYQRPWRNDPEIEDRNARKYLPATPEAQQWDGFGTALKPSHEPIVVARKPLIGTVAQNVLEWGTGAINVDGTRVKSGGTHGSAAGVGRGAGYDAPEHNGPDRKYGRGRGGVISPPHPQGRWPANVCHDGSDEVLEVFARAGESKGGSPVRNNKNNPYGSERTWSTSSTPAQQTRGYMDEGTPARFFYTAKASRRERGEGNNHPTVKSLALMRWLVRLVTPPGGMVLDPFMGSGTTGMAAKLEGFGFIGCDNEAHYFAIAQRRIAEAQMQPLLFEIDS